MSGGRALAAAGAAFLVLVGIALAWDSVHILRAARDDLADVDRELRMHEERLVSVVSSVPVASERMRVEVRSWSEAKTRPARHEAYRALVDTVRRDMVPHLDVQDANARRLADGIAGALNRHDVALRAYDERSVACRATAGTRRGRLAAWLLDLKEPCED